MGFLFRRQPPEFTGYVDGVSEGHVRGWAYDRTRPRRRLALGVYVAGERVGISRAELYRQDLANAGIGDGCCGFDFELPDQSTDSETVSVKVGQTDFWLINHAAMTIVERSGELMNSLRKGLPILSPGLSFRSVDELDIEIASQLQSEWCALAATKGSDDFIGQKSMWQSIAASRHRTLLGLLKGSDPRQLAEHLVNLQKLAASEGLSQGERAYRDFVEASPDGRRAAILPFHDMLGSLAQYLAVIPGECAEYGFDGDAMGTTSDELVAKIETALGFSIAPQTIFDGVFGLLIRDRILHGRDIQALYAALRAIEASALARPRVCEVGGGFGKVAYYAWMLGARRYSIVDLPTVAAMQYFYLRRSLPEVEVRFCHPDAVRSDRDGIDLFFASHMQSGVFLPSDIVLNCDSFPELGTAVCRQYFSLVRNWAPVLLSINQESNKEIRGPSDRQVVVGELLPEFGFTRLYRFRSWVRKGYVEELWSSRRSLSTAENAYGGTYKQ
jgi:hypothetical protein